MMMTMIAMKTAGIETAIPTIALVLSPPEVPGGSVLIISPVVIGGGVTPVLVGLLTIVEK